MATYDLTGWAEKAHNCAFLHGWWDRDVSIFDVVANVHGEWSEALNEYAHNRPMEYVIGDKGEAVTDPELFGDRKPEGMATELIDGVIRLLDWMGSKGVDPGILMQRNAEFPEDGETELICSLHIFTVAMLVLYNSLTQQENAEVCIRIVFDYLAARGIDPMAVLKRKYRYNLTRSYRHGGKKV